ncbi:hypothetical protein HU200_038421 [Digitaria exilis]|uniref:Uncharacterized protein n=1 Tax=Digitaria exilis TaxID=1010633 RepID=A0A835BDX0_9POAL|nr:hypothetical protein HU200_038421 [Digitaria exilis]
MATTPEEFFLQSTIEPIPPSPSVFLDLPKTPDGLDVTYHDAALVLPYVSCMLMEDDTDERLLNQYSDHPLLVEVQQSFAQIISSDSFDTNSVHTGTIMASHSVCHDKELDANRSLQDSNGDQTSSTFDTDVVGAFLKGVEEASRFLPKHSYSNMDKFVDQNFHGSSNNRPNEKEVGRDNNVLMTVKMPYGTAPREMFDELMLFGYETCKKDMANLHGSMTIEVVKKQRKGHIKVTRDVVDIHALLILCVQAVTTNNRKGAGDLLKQIKQYASIKGDATQRLAQCLAEGLEARLAGTSSYVHNSSIMAKPPSIVEFLSAYKLYMAASTFNKVAHMFTTSTILHAMEGKNKLHIVQFGTNFGLEWPCLIRQLANRQGGPPEVRITSIVCPQPSSFPIQWAELTGCQLGNCSRKYGITVEFHTIVADLEAICLSDLKTDPSEVLVLIDLFNLSTLMDESIFFDMRSPKDTVLNNIRKMQPSVFIQSIVNCTATTSFATRFREALFYYMALFDMFDATIPRESEPRFILEQSMFGRSALNIVACEGLGLMDRPENYRQWQVRNQRAGLKQLPLNPCIVQALMDNVMKFHHKDFLLGQDNQWLVQGWKGRVLFAHATWVAEGPPSSHWQSDQ